MSSDFICLFYIACSLIILRLNCQLKYERCMGDIRETVALPARTRLQV